MARPRPPASRPATSSPSSTACRSPTRPTSPRRCGRSPAVPRPSVTFTRDGESQTAQRDARHLRGLISDRADRTAEGRDPCGPGLRASCAHVAQGVTARLDRPRARVRNMPEHHPETAAPSLVGVSYVMPVLNDATHVRAAVESILAQDYDGPRRGAHRARSRRSTAPTSSSPTSPRAMPRIRVLENEVGSTPAGLNIGIRAAQYPVVVRVDSHSMLPTRLRARRGRDARAHRRRQRRRHHGRAAARPRSSRRSHSRTRRRSASAARRSTSAATRGPPRPCTSASSAATRSSGSASSTRRSSAARTGSSTVACATTGGTVWFTPELAVTYRPALDASSGSPARCSRPASGAASSHDGSRRRTASATSSRRSWSSASLLGLLARHRRHRAGGGRGDAVAARSASSIPRRLPALRRRRRRSSPRAAAAPAPPALVSRSLAVHTRLVGRRASCSATSR